MMLRQIGFRRILPGLVAPNLEQRFFGAGEQGGVYLFDKAHQGGLFQDAAFTTPVTAVEQYVGSFLDWSGNANHCAQTTSTARSKWSARVNLHVRTEQFSNAYWAKTTGVSVSPGAITSPTGGLADTLAYDGSGVTGSYRLYGGGILHPAGVSLTQYIMLRSVSGATTVRIGGNVSGGGFLVCNLTTEWQKFQISGVSNGSSVVQLLIYSVVGNNDPFTIGVWGASCTYTADAHLPYQWVNTATDYDTAGFPHYLVFDGTDDYYASIGNIDFSGTDKMTVVAGYTKGDAGTSMQPLVEFLGYSSAGSFGLYTNPSGQLAQIQLSSFGVNLYAAGYPPGLAYVITAQTDLAAPFMQIRRDGVLAHQSFTAPTGTPYGNAALRIGRRFIGSGFLKGPVHGLIVRGAASSDAELSFAERYLANLQGRAL